MTRRDAASTNGDGRETLVYIPGSASGRVIQRYDGGSPVNSIRPHVLLLGVASERGECHVALGPVDCCR
jgi:hypothetical protein